MNQRTITKSIYLKASKEQVWAFLTDPEKLGFWFHKPTVPLTKGQPLEMFGTTSGDLLIWGDVIEAKPFDYLEYTFTVKPMGDAVSTVKWTLEDVAGGTRLNLEHSSLPASAEAFGLTLSLDKGWDEHLMSMRAIET
ncbi:MAG: SRPBCC family protein [Marinosulfonomonas sp.]